MNGHRESFQWFFVGVENACAEIGGSAGVEDGAADDVWSFLKGEPFGDAVVNYGLAIAVNADNLLAVQPLNGSRIRADGEPHVAQFFWRIDDRHGPEKNVGGGYVVIAGEVVEVHVVVLSVHSVPCQTGFADFHLVTIAGNDAELNWCRGYESRGG